MCVCVCSFIQAYEAKHLDEETEMRISEEQQALSENIRGIEKMSEDEKMLLERLKALNSAHQEASNELAMALSHDPFAEAESVAGAGADAIRTRAILISSVSSFSRRTPWPSLPMPHTPF